MNITTILNTCAILFAVAALVFIILSLYRSRPRAGLHPLAFAGLSLLLAAKLCDLLRFQPPDRLLFDAFVCFALIFGMVGSYARTYFGTWKNRGVQLRSPPVA